MLLTAKEICQYLRIGRTHFDRFKPELYQAGMFRLNGPRSEYRMRREDFDRYIETKINTK